MNNSNISNEVLAISEFRRFANAYIYKDTLCNIMAQIQMKLGSDMIQYDPNPQSILKFNCSNIDDNNRSNFISDVHQELKKIFINFYNDPIMVKTIKSRIYSNVQDPNIQNILISALSEIRLGNPRYIGLLFNITILNNLIYLYL